MLDDSLKEESIDKILENIKAAIEKKSSKKELTGEDEVIELTEIIEEQSEDITDKDNFQGVDSKNILLDKEIKEAFREVLKPYLKSWLNSNLPKIVKQTVEQEVRQLFTKIR